MFYISQGSSLYSRQWLNLEIKFKYMPIMPSYPKILIIGQTFNEYTGGGITLSNLFYGWPKDRIAVLANNEIYIVPNEVCDNNRGLNRYKWPFSLLFRRGKGKSRIHLNSMPPSNPYASRFSLISKLGITPMLHSSHLDKEKIAWICAFDPDIIYTQLADYSIIKIVSQLKRLTGKPVVIHFMDDWPSDIYDGPFLNKYYRNQTLDRLMKLIDEASCVVCICEMMAKTYSVRYGVECHYLYNAPIIQHTAGLKRIGADKYNNIGYFGRAGKGNFNTLVHFLNVLTHHEDIQMTVFSPDYKSLVSYQKSKNISINPAVPRSNVIEMYKDMDLLYLPMDFDEDSVKFTRLSFSSKVFDYFSSNIPVLLQAPRDIAMTEFFLENKCGFVISDNSTSSIESFILDFSTNILDVTSVLNNAQLSFNKYANFDSNRSEFLRILNSVTSKA